MNRRRVARATAWGMLAFALISWPVSFVIVPNEPWFLIMISELALVYEAFTALMVSDENV